MREAKPPQLPLGQHVVKLEDILDYLDDKVVKCVFSIEGFPELKVTVLASQITATNPLSKYSIIASALRGAPNDPDGLKGRRCLANVQRSARKPEDFYDLDNFKPLPLSETGMIVSAKVPRRPTPVPLLDQSTINKLESLSCGQEISQAMLVPEKEYRSYNKFVTKSNKDKDKTGKEWTIWKAKDYPGYYKVAWRPWVKKAA